MVAGLILGQGGLGALELDPGSDFVQGLAVIALILILFRMGSRWRRRCEDGLAPPVSKARAAMRLPRAGGEGTTADRSGIDRSFTLVICFPYRHVLSYTCHKTAGARVFAFPHLESGLTGLALPAVLAFTAAAEDRDGSCGGIRASDVGWALVQAW